MNKKYIVLLMSVVGMLGILLPAAPVQAADCVIDADGNVVCVNDVIINTVGSSQHGVVAQSTGTGSATAINNGTVSVDRTGLYANAAGSGDATTSNTATIAVAANGMVARAVSGDATATNSGTVTANRYGLYATSTSGDVTVTNAFTGEIVSSDANKGALWAVSDGSGTLSATNEGWVETDGFGLWVQSTGGGEVSATNSGFVMAERTALWVETTTGSANVTATNSGMMGSLRTGMVARNGGSGDVTLTNSGYVAAKGYGLQAWATGGGTVTVTNSGEVTALNNVAIWVDTPSGGTVNNSGYVAAVTDEGDITAILTSDGNDVVTNSGFVGAANFDGGYDVVGIQAGAGNDTVVNSGRIITYDGIIFENVMVAPTIIPGTAIDTGTGDDTVIIQGGEVFGLVDGGPDWDRLAFGALVGAGDFEAAYAELQAQLDSADPAGGTITFRGQSYTYANFEELLNWIRSVRFYDGRINPYDIAAPATGWCAGGGAQLYRIHADGVGEWVYNVTDGQVQAALEQAFATGQHVLIADRLGVQLWALADLSAEGVQQLQLMGPDYLYIFPANTCGFTD